MRNKSIVLFIIICLVIGILTMIPSYSYADDSMSLQSIIDDGAAFLDKGKQQETVDTQEIKDIVIPVAQILVGVGNAVVVIGIAIIGIKYMVSSPESKAKLKTQLVGLCISAVVIFGAEIIWKIAYEFFNSMA